MNKTTAQERAKSVRSWLVSIVVLVVILSQPLSALGQTDEETATVTNTATVETAAATEQTAVPTTTQVATETATPEATVIATETATEVATESPTVQATEVPAQATAIATESARPTEPPTATATETPAAASDQSSKSSLASASSFAVASVPACAQIGTGSNGSVDFYAVFECSETTTPHQIRATLSTEWQWAYSFGSAQTPTEWTPGTDLLSATTNSSNSDLFYIYLSPRTAQSSRAATLLLDVLKPNGNPIRNHTLTAERPLPAPEFQLACSPAALTVATSDTGTISCELSGSNLDSSASVTVNSISVTSPAAWAIAGIPSSGTLTGDTPFTFTLGLTPGCGAVTNPPAPNVIISSQLMYRSSTFAGPSTSITAKHNATANVSASITSGSSLEWSRTYSFAPQSVSGSLGYQVVASGCAGWNIQVSATALTYAGTAGGSPIASSAISVTPGAPSALSGSIANVSPGMPGTLGAPIKVLSANESNGIGTYRQTLDIDIAIPGAARVGTYTSTITIAAASGP